MKRKLLNLALFSTSLMLYQGPTFAADRPVVAAPVVQATVNASVPDPRAQLLDMAARFRHNDVTALVHDFVPDSAWQQLLNAYDISRNTPVTDANRAEFKKSFGALLDPDAVNKLMSQWQPQLNEARAQLPAMQLMVLGGIEFSINSKDNELTPNQRATLQKVFPGLQTWITETDFLNEQNLRAALTLICDSARHSGITSLDDLKTLPLDAALDRADAMLLAAKRAVRLYGIDLDAIADSMRVDVLAINGDKAHVRTTFTVFNTAIPVELDLVLRDGRWYGKDTPVNFATRHTADQKS